MHSTEVGAMTYLTRMYKTAPIRMLWIFLLAAHRLFSSIFMIIYMKKLYSMKWFLCVVHISPASAIWLWRNTLLLMTTASLPTDKWTNYSTSVLWHNDTVTTFQAAETSRKEGLRRSDWKSCDHPEVNVYSWFVPTGHGQTGVLMLRLGLVPE